MVDWTEEALQTALNDFNSLRSRIRAEALEEAAIYVENSNFVDYEDNRNIATAIRALKDKPKEGGE